MELMNSPSVLCPSVLCPSVLRLFVHHRPEHNYLDNHHHSLTIFTPVATDTIVSIDYTESIPTTVQTVTIITSVSTSVITEIGTTTTLSESTDIIVSTSTDIIVSTPATETSYSVAATDTFTTADLTTTTTTTSTTTTTTTSTPTVTKVYDLVFGPLPDGCFIDLGSTATDDWYGIDHLRYFDASLNANNHEAQIIGCAEDCLGIRMSHLSQ
jgi:hypothetical protein